LWRPAGQVLPWRASFVKGMAQWLRCTADVIKGVLTLRLEGSLHRLRSRFQQLPWKPCLSSFAGTQPH
jgi:hypothetical protein